MWERICPVCEQTVVHKNIRSWRWAVQYELQCSVCARKQSATKTQTQEFRKAQSKRIAKVWADENGTFNSPEYRKSLHDGQLEYYRNLTPEQRDERAAALKLSWVDADERMKRLLEVCSRPDAIEARRQGLIKSWANNSEGREKQSQEASARMQDPEYKERCTRKLIEAAQSTGGTSKHEKEIAEFLVQFGFTHHIRLGSNYVDFFNAQVNIAVEYYGDWWHCHPKFDKRIEEYYGGIHPNIELTPTEKREFDNIRIEKIKCYCKDVIIIWESDIFLRGRLDKERLVSLLNMKAL